jgi:hypothetical protein
LFDVDELCHVAMAGEDLCPNTHVNTYTYTLTSHKWLDCFGGVVLSVCDIGVTAGCFVVCAELGHVP